MDWKVENALNRDIERQHLNKILAEIKAAIASRPATATTNSGTSMTNTVTRYAVARFTLNLTGDVTGSTLIDGTSDVELETTLENVEGFVEEAPVDSRYYWRRNGEWRAVPMNLTQRPEGVGLLVQTVDDEDVPYNIVREIAVEAGELTVADADGQAADPTLGLADLADSGAGTGGVKLITRDAKGRVSGTQNASTTNLPEGSNLYFTDERAMDAIAAMLTAGANITLTYNDGANTLTIDSTSTSSSTFFA